MAEASIHVYLLNEQMNESFCNTVFVSLKKYSLGFFSHAIMWFVNIVTSAERRDTSWFI